MSRSVPIVWLLLGLPACEPAVDTNPAELGVEGSLTRAHEALGSAGTAGGPSIVASELLGRATDHAVTLKASFDQSVNAYVEFGPSSGTYPQRTDTASFSDGMVEIVVSGLDADSLYYYRLRYGSGAGAFGAGSEHTFRTQRSPASTFTFDVQTDSHQGYAPFFSSALYGATLGNIASDHPDLLFDLGDAVSTDDQSETATSVNQKYAAQRTFFDLVAHSTPVYLVLGNHENEEGWNLDDFGANVQNSLPVLGANGRKRYFSNPVPDGFYTGNSDQLAALDGDHLRGDYYAFEWGSALFVALDPFWYTTVKPYAGPLGGEKDDEVVGTRWDWTLGKAQYDWLDRTLAESSAPFKFVFAHHPTGGTSDYIRGGALGAKYCEWGGYETDGTTWGFGAHRPGWAMPVQELLSERGVTAFFHGHDHVFAREELDGVVYQECPQAANPDYGTGFASNASDYAGAVLANDSGHLRVTVSPTLVTVDYVRAYLAGDGANGSVAYSYTISPCTAAGSDGKACEDGNACTSADACVAGQCHGAPRACAASDECHAAGVCEPSTGSCSNPAVVDGTPCSGGTCVAGVCIGEPDAGATGGTGGVAGASNVAGTSSVAGTGGVAGASNVAGMSSVAGTSSAAGTSSVAGTSGVAGTPAVAGAGMGGVTSGGGVAGVSDAAGEAGAGESGRDQGLGGSARATGGSDATGGSSANAAGGSSARATGGTSGASGGARPEGDAGTRGQGAQTGEEAGAPSAGTGNASGGLGGLGGGSAGRGAAGTPEQVAASAGASTSPARSRARAAHRGCACRVGTHGDAGTGGWLVALGLTLGFARRRRLGVMRAKGSVHERPRRTRDRLARGGARG